MSSTTTVVAARPADRPPVPSAVLLSVALLLGAMLAGVAEPLVRLALPGPADTAGLAARTGIGVVAAVLVVLLRTGHDAIRWAVVGVLGVAGTLPLVLEPIGALASGATVSGYLVGASGVELLAALLRGLHLTEVIVAMALLFHPAAHAFFRPKIHP